jgi:hypothetical protein
LAAYVLQTSTTVKRKVVRINIGGEGHSIMQMCYFLDKVVVGSFQGYLRIYEPHPPGFTPSHVILEKQLDSPVVQVAAGRFLQ